MPEYVLAARCDSRGGKDYFAPSLVGSQTDIPIPRGHGFIKTIA